MKERGIWVPICVDGGVTEETGRRLVEAGADVLIAGSFLFRSEDIGGQVRRLKAL